MQRLTLYIFYLLIGITLPVSAQDNGTTPTNTEAPTHWGNIDYDGAPWVENISKPYRPSKGLQGRHVALWASHGRYYDQREGKWCWQRPRLFCTTEDLFTQTIVVPYLIPMLEKAGACVFTPRERDWQKEEIIVDNDGPGRNYIEVTSHGKWQTTDAAGFAWHAGNYADGENPFMAGTARMVKTTTSRKRYSLATYQPDFRKAGRYAVYVSYQTLPNSTDNALYTVWHRGERTQFYVNQQMGGSTWVYLGTFDFDAGYSEFNRVTVSNQSHGKGIVTTDAVRFGGGMGNIQRFGQNSGMPRALEGARYYAQWAGMPYDVYSSKQGQDDYGDDINARSLSVNLLGGGSCYMPQTDGRKVPFELSLAVHSDAGYALDGYSTYGPLAICTTNFNNGLLNAGLSRQTSYRLAKDLLENEKRDIQAKYGIKWQRSSDKPEFYDRNYSETRLPDVPSAIIETMSHESFPDMRHGQDPNFRFTLARSIYKTLLRTINGMHDKEAVVAPLAPNYFHIVFKDKDEVRLTWNATLDPQEATASPTGYIVYTATGDADFDNGTYVQSKNYLDVQLEPNQLYHFKVAAVNKGGESFTTEVLSALYNPKATKTVMVVNGFHRLSSPTIRNTNTEQGFDLDEDPGITYGPTLGWLGRQVNFDRRQRGNTNGGLGDSSDEMAGKLIAGNDFDYVRTHAKAIETASRYNIVSCSSEALDMIQLSPSLYAAIDLILGLERDDRHSLIYYKAMNNVLQRTLKSYTAQGGALLVSGAYVGSDMMGDDEQLFLASLLKCRYAGAHRSANPSAPWDVVNGLGTTMQYWSGLNSQHYAATRTDILQPVTPAFAAMQYVDGQDAAIAYKGNDYRAFTMGFPFECISDSSKQGAIMRGIMDYLIQ